MHTQIAQVSRRAEKFPEVEASVGARFADMPMVDEDFDDLFGGTDLDTCGIASRLGCGVRWVGYHE